MGCQKEVVQMKNHELDVVDRTILNILQRNAKCLLKEIAAIWKDKDTDRIFNSD